MSEHAACLHRDQPRRAFRRSWPLAALTLISLLALLLAGCGTQAGDWRLLSPAGVRIYSMAADPNIPTLVYAGADNGSVYRSRADQKGLAIPSEGIPADVVVASLLPDPQVPGRLFAGTTAGLYRSDHYGDRWSAFGRGLPSGSAALALASTPDGSLMMAGLDGRGIYRSADDGATWTVASNGLPAKATVTALIWDQTGSTWWAGLQGSTGHGIYKSADSGQTWTPADGLIAARTSVNAFAIAQGQPGDADTLFAATSAGVYDNTGGLESWRKIANGLPSGAALAVTAIPGEPGGVVVAIGAGVYASTDNGVSWAPVAQGLAEPVQALAVAKDGNGARVYFAASSQLARYPSGVSASNSPSFLLIAVIALTLILGGYVIMRRSRRFGYSMGALDNERTVGRTAEAERAWERQRGGSETGGLSTTLTNAGLRREAGKSAPSHTLAPADLTTKEQTGAPANPDKAAQNGHGDPTQRTE
jgi:hypothetical protein